MICIVTFDKLALYQCDQVFETKNHQFLEEIKSIEHSKNRQNGRKSPHPVTLQSTSDRKLR